MISREPKRDNNTANLAFYFLQRIHILFDRLKARGFDPEIFEGYRTNSRQIWLYGYGRTHHIGCKPKTWTRHGKHNVNDSQGKPCGKAVDVISKKDYWSNPAFYNALQEEVNAISGIETLTPTEQCHVQWTG